MQDSNNYAIQTINLTKEFISDRNLATLLLHPFQKRNTVLAVDGVNLQIRKGEIFGLVGVNGAGKTTLIKMLTTFILPTKGTAYINGYDITKDGQKVKASIGLVTSEQNSFYYSLTGRQNLNFFASFHGLTFLETKKKIDELASLLDIEEYLEIMFKEYSSGIRQRLSIARSLLNNPDILLIDEPTKSLDFVNANNLRLFIKEELSRKLGKTIVFTTHNLQEAEQLADRIAIMDKGKVKASGAIQELCQKIGKPQARLEEIFTELIAKDVPA